MSKFQEFPGFKLEIYVNYEQEVECLSNTEYKVDYVDIHCGIINRIGINNEI